MNVYIETYGCTANKSDESLMRGLLRQGYHEFVDNIQDADLLILLTCTVISTTEQRMLSRLKIFQKTHKKIIVAGCMASVQPDLISAIIPDALLLPPANLHNINNIVNETKPALTTVKKTFDPKSFSDVIAPISIAEGCERSCSYCITHFARGRLHSYPADTVIADIQSALQQGCSEIQLTAQDTASYGIDIGTNLGELLKRVCVIKGAFRIRVGMMNPVTLKKNLNHILDAYASPKLYTFLHLPVQSGDDDILQKMDRGYTVDDFLMLVNRFREQHPTGTLSTDVIVGFPSETENQFQNTIQLIKKVKPDIINITRFSARPYTAAKTMVGRVPTHVVKNRSVRLTDICSTISLEKNKQHVGKRYHVLITEKGKQNTVTGRAENYKQIVVKEPQPLGKFIDVEIIDAAPTHLVGKLI